MNYSKIKLQVALFFICASALAFAGWQSDLLKAGIKTNGRYIQFTSSKATLGASGTAINQLKYGRLVFNNASTTTQAYTMTGMTSTDTVIVRANSAYSATANITSMVPSTGSLLVTWSGDPGTTVSMGYIWLR